MKKKIESIKNHWRRHYLLQKFRPEHPLPTGSGSWGWTAWGGSGLTGVHLGSESSVWQLGVDECSSRVQIAQCGGSELTGAHLGPGQPRVACSALTGVQPSYLILFWSSIPIRHSDHELGSDNFHSLGISGYIQKHCLVVMGDGGQRGCQSPQCTGSHSKDINRAETEVCPVL